MVHAGERDLGNITHSSISPWWTGRSLHADLRDVAIALEHDDAVWNGDATSIRDQMLLGFVVAFVERLLELTRLSLRIRTLGV